MNGWASRIMVLAAVWMGLVLPACEENPPAASPSTQTSSATPSTAADPEGLDVEQVQVSSLDDLVVEVAERGAKLLLVLPGARPTEVHFWGGDGHLHIRTEYIDHRGEKVVIIQAKFDEGDTLTEGKAVSVRGHRGVEADRNWYWRERGWIIAAPADPSIAEKLSWLNAS
jgi:hypothetical protein